MPYNLNDFISFELKDTDRCSVCVLPVNNAYTLMLHVSHIVCALSVHEPALYGTFEYIAKAQIGTNWPLHLCLLYVKWSPHTGYLIGQGCGRIPSGQQADSQLASFCGQSTRQVAFYAKQVSYDNVSRTHAPGHENLPRGKNKLCTSLKIWTWMKVLRDVINSKSTLPLISIKKMPPSHHSPAVTRIRTWVIAATTQCPNH